MNRKALHYTSVAVLLFLSALFLYFYLTGRIERYVAPEFRTWALAAGLGLAVLGLFNLVTARAAVDCGHDHSHDHGDEHDHDHSHDEGACSDHSHDHEHDHSHDHGHDHGTGEEEEHHHHEDSPAGIVLALVVLTLPMLVAANYSRDTYSPEYQIRWADITENLQRIEAKRKIKREQAVGGPSIADRPPSTAVSPTGTGVTDENPGAPVGADVAAADTPPATTTDEGTEGQVGGTAGEPDAAAATDADDDGWGEFTIEDLKRMVPQSSEGNFLLEVPQLFYTANDTELQRVLEGLPIETIAQVMPISKDTQEMNPDAATRRLRLFRMFVECCAADMRPLPVTIEFKDGIPTYEEMGWVKVVGKVRYEHVDGVTAPIVDVISIEPTAEPMDMMVY
jgi:hypothetical protein